MEINRNKEIFEGILNLRSRSDPVPLIQPLNQQQSIYPLLSPTNYIIYPEIKPRAPSILTEINKS